ncbi:MAG: NADH-ubiquinone oxidoreductase-F iron-sulfur binding region domain-containing protein, partial [Cutibacterium acnes]|nr:NADH-ubiquinone oxidoreductase-F iron-sulfur binding region domain-containing protein [Cutibacterium acnes]
EKSDGFTIYSLSGHLAHPGQYEAPMGTTLRQLLDISGGMRQGHELKFFTPGGSSTPILTKDDIDLPLDYEGMAGAKTMLGTKALQCFDETTSVVRVTLRWLEFYKHESCGKCTPCREGTWWVVQMLRRIEAGEGQEGDVDKLMDIADNIGGRSFCALADGAVGCLRGAIGHFRDEFEAGCRGIPAWQYLPYKRSSIFNDADRRVLEGAGA